MPILIMGVLAALVFCVIVTVMVAAALKEGQEQAREAKPKDYPGKPVKPAV